MPFAEPVARLAAYPGAFAIAVVTIGIVISTNGSPSEVEFLGTVVRFPSSADTPAEIQRQRDELEQFAEEAEAGARNEPQAAITAAVDLSGWGDGPNGAAFEIGQFGSALVLNEVTPSGITATGQGSIVDDQISSAFVAADGSEGIGRFGIEDDSRLRGTFESGTNQFEQSATLTW